MPAKHTFTSIRVRGAAEFDGDVTVRGQGLGQSSNSASVIKLTSDNPTYTGTVQTGAIVILKTTEDDTDNVSFFINGENVFTVAPATVVFAIFAGDRWEEITHRGL